MEDSIRRAMKVATEAHRGQSRWGGGDYITHPIAVSELVETTDEKVVALLHDVLEDTTYTNLFELHKEFGPDVSQALVLLTKVSFETYTVYLRNIKESPLARSVKIADLKHNLSDLENYPRKKHLKEKYEASLLYLDN